MRKIAKHDIIERKYPNIVYTTGFGRDGSTLLSFILGNHPEILSVGEFNGMPPSFSQRTCRCSELIRDCEFWKTAAKVLLESNQIDIMNQGPVYFDVHSELSWRGPRESLLDLLKIIVTMSGNISLHNLLKMLPVYRSLHTKLDNNFIAFRELADLNQASFVYDSSKIPMRMKLLYMHKPEKVKVLYLVRDGRAVFASIKRYQLAAPRVRLKRWVRVHQQCKLQLRSIPDEQKLMIKYEDLCTNPELIVTEILAFLGLPFVETIMNFSTKVHHDIGGSPSNLLRSSVIKLDERWRTELTQEDLLIFKKIGGKTQHQLGYPLGIT